MEFWATLAVNILGLGFMGWQVRLMKIQIAGLPSTRSAKRVTAEKQLTRRMYIPVVLMAVLVVISWLPYLLAKPDVLPTMITAWGANENLCDVFADTTSVMGAANKYRLFLMCRVEDPSIDPFENTHIGVSEPYTITGGQQALVVRYASNPEIAKVAVVGSPVSQTLILLPKDQDGTTIKKLSDVVRYGGIVLHPGAKKPF